MDNFRKKSKRSFMLNHQKEEHQGVAGDYTAKVTDMTREAVLIRSCEVPVLNSKTEWHQPALYRIQNEIYRG